MELLSIFEKGNYSKVIDKWNTDQFQSSSDPEAAFIAAASYFRLGDMEKACKLCESIEGVFNNNSGYLSMYAAILRRLNLFSRAETIFLRALDLSPESKEVKNNYSNLLIDQGRLDEAINILNDILRSSPNYSDAMQNLARAEGVKAQLEYNDTKKRAESIDENDIFGDPLDRAFEIEEVVKCGAKLESVSASVRDILSNTENQNLEQAELELLKLAIDQINNKQYRGCLEILQKLRSRAGLYSAIYKAASDAFIGLEQFKDAEIHALVAFINGEATIANLVNLASLSAMRKDQLMAQKWLVKAEELDKSNSLVVQCKELLFPSDKSRESDLPFALEK